MEKCPFSSQIDSKRNDYMVNLRELDCKADLIKVFQDIGKMDGINRLVKRVYQYNILDKRIAHFFDIEMIQRFESMFGSFLVGLLGGKPYNRIAMIKSHRSKVNLTDTHFNAFLDNLTIAMMHEKIPHSAINTMVDLIEKTREDVTGRTDITAFTTNRLSNFPSQVLNQVKGTKGSKASKGGNPDVSGNGGTTNSLSTDEFKSHNTKPCHCNIQ